MSDATSSSMGRHASLVAVRLGLDLERSRRSWRRRPPTPPGVVSLTTQSRPHAPITIILGASGSGKTTLLEAEARRAEQRGWRVIRENTSLTPACAIDRLVARGMTIDESMGALTRAGLGDARCFLAPANQLSTGQQARLRLLLAMAKDSGARILDSVSSNWPPNPEPRTLLLLDEFASSIDDVTARGITTMLRRWARAGHHRQVLLATHRESLIPWLSPARIIHLEGQARAQISLRRTPAPDPLGRIVIERAEVADLQALLPHHYRAGMPATIAGLWRAVESREDGSGEPRLAGVLCLSMPTLNARWRDLAWPGRYSVGGKSSRARRLNREVRCISRVIVEPRYRGLGLARHLVQSYLNDPLTPSTESVSALGPGAMFHERAGMTSYPLAPSSRDARLLDALAHGGIDAPLLCAPRLALARAVENGSHALVERELCRWAHSSRAGAPAKGMASVEVLRRAARTIGGASIAFAHTSS